MAKPRKVPAHIVQRWRDATDGLSSFFALGARCKNYIAGRQWSEEEKAVLERRNQAAIVFNQLAAPRRYVLSLFERMRRDITVLPRNSGDEDKAWVMARVIDAVYDANDVETKRLWVARDAIDVGIGWWYVARSADLTRDPISIQYVPWDEMIWDTAAKQPDLSDAEFVARVKWASVHDVKAAFPRWKRQIEAALSAELWLPEDVKTEAPVVDDATGRRPAYAGPGAWYDRLREMVQIMEWWEYRWEDLPCLYQGDVLVPYDEEMHADLVAAGARLVQAPVRVPYVLLICGDIVLAEERMPYRHFSLPFVPVIYDWDDEARVPRGMIADLLDPQDEVNKRRSKAIHFLNMNQVILESGAVADIDELRDELADPEGVIVKRPNKQLEIVRNLDLSKGHMEMMMEAIQEIRQVSGIYADAVGQPTNARTGAAIQARQQGTQVSLVIFLRSLLNAERRMAEITMALIKQYYRSERVFRITDAKGQQAFLQLNKRVRDPVTGQEIVENALQSLQADLVVSMRSPFASERQAMAAQLAEIMKTAPPQLHGPLLDLWLDFLDIPNKDEIRQRMQQAAQAAQAAAPTAQAPARQVQGMLGPPQGRPPQVQRNAQPIARRR